MDGMERIPIPWKDRWSRFRHTMLPAAGFLAVVAITLCLWIQQSEMPRSIGELETVRLQIASDTGGILTLLPQGQWTLYDRVEPQQVIAQFDDRALRAQMATLAEDLTRLQKELDAAGAKLTVSEADRSRAAWDDATRLSFELEQHRLVALQKRLQLEVDRLKAEQANTALECMKPLAEKKMVSALEMNNARMLREETAKQAAEDQKVLAEAETQQKQAAERLRTLPALVPADVARELAAIAAAASVQKARIRALQVEIDHLTLRGRFGGRFAPSIIGPMSRCAQVIQSSPLPPKRAVTSSATYGRNSDSRRKPAWRSKCGAVRRWAPRCDPWWSASGRKSKPFLRTCAAIRKYPSGACQSASPFPPVLSAIPESCSKSPSSFAARTRASSRNRMQQLGGKGDRSSLPERPGGCFAQIGPVPFFPRSNCHLAGGPAGRTSANRGKGRSNSSSSRARSRWC